MADTAGGEKDVPKSGWNGFIDDEALTARKSRTGLFVFNVEIYRFVMYNVGIICDAN